MLKDVVPGYGVQYFDWKGRPFAAIKPTLQEHGWPKRNAFRQPLLVQVLYDGLARYPNVQVRFEHALRSFEQDDGGVRCRLDTPGGETTIAAPWLIACDGGRSTVRELCGIVLDGSTYPERWLIVDLAERTVPLRHTSTYCDPARPAIRLPGPHGALRYEFMLREGDRDDDVLADATFRRWITDRVPEDAALPLVRKAIYGFHARVATRWKHGRVLLAGDAAHLTPPFAGQGLNSGIRDAANLGWKLAAVTRWGTPATLMDSYEPERRPHATALIRMAQRIGTFMQPKSVLGAAATQSALRAAILVPAFRDYILQLRFKPKPRLGQGGRFVATAAQPFSELLPQPFVEHAERGQVRLDDLLGSGFAVLGFDTPGFRAHAARLLPDRMPGRTVALLRPDADFIDAAPAVPMERVRDGSGELSAMLDRYGATAIVVRPDRYWLQLIEGRVIDPVGRGARAPEQVAPAAAAANAPSMPTTDVTAG